MNLARKIKRPLELDSKGHQIVYTSQGYKRIIVSIEELRNQLRNSDDTQ